MNSEARFPEPTFKATFLTLLIAKFISKPRSMWTVLDRSCNDRSILVIRGAEGFMICSNECFKA